MSTNKGPFTQAPASRPPNRDLSPSRMVATLVIIIFLAEIIAMFVVRYLPIENYLASTLLDGFIMILLISPGLYLLQVQPLLTEINERIQAEQAVRAGENLLRRVLELLPVGVRIIDKRGKIQHKNPASQTIWEGDRSINTGHIKELKGWWADTKKRIEPDEWAAVRALNRGEVFLNEEIEIESFDGARKVLLNSALPILDENQEIQGAVIVNQDITELRQREEALIRANELLERVFFSTDTLIAHLDRDFNFIRVNETYAKSGGNPAEFYPGKNHFDLYPHQENQAIFQRVVETGEPFSVIDKPFEYADHPEWGVTYWNWSLQPVKRTDGWVEGVVLSMVDTTARKRAEMQLERQNQELRELSNAEHRQRELAEGLVQAMITINTSLELNQVLCMILEQIRKVIHFQGANIVLLEGSDLRLASSLGFEDHANDIPLKNWLGSLDNTPLLQQVVRSLQPVIIDSVKAHSGWHWQATPGMEWVHSFVAVPLITSGNVIGIINLYSDHPDAFTPEDIQQLVAFAHPAALAINNAHLYKAESNARQVAVTMSTAAQELTRKLNLEHVINTLLDHIQVIVHSQTACFALLEDQGRLAVRASRGRETSSDQEDLLNPCMEPITDEVIQKVITDHKSLTIPITYPKGENQGEPGDNRSLLAVPIIASEKVIGLIALGSGEGELFSPDQIQWAEALVGQAAVAIQNAWLFQQVRSSSERLQSLARKLVEVQENERYHIARELHDEAGQSLSSLKLNLGRLEQDPDCPAHMRQSLQGLKIVADGVLEELHRLAMDLRPVALDHLGLVAALRQYANNLNSEQFCVQFKAVGFDGDRLNQDLETALYRIVQEALTNVVRHAQASNAGILLERGGGRVKVFVEDDGTGFVPDQVEGPDCLGLVGMRERAEMFGGTLTIESSLENGTSIIVEVPDGNSHPYRR